MIDIPWRVELLEPAPCMCPLCPCQRLNRIQYDETQASASNRRVAADPNRHEPLYLCPDCYYGNHQK